jgi:methyl-accepting chemotaxis protein
MKRFKDWKISVKIMGISIFTIALIVSGMLFYFLPLVEKKLMEEKRNATKAVTDVAYTLIASYEAKVKSGELKLDEAQKRAMAGVKALRYHGNEYYFIIGANGAMVMHAIKEEMAGKDTMND